MTSTELSNRRRVQNALATLIDTDQNDNSFRYFRAADLVEIDPELSAAMVGSHLPKIEDESPLDGGLIVERYADRRCGATLWIVRRESAHE